MLALLNQAGHKVEAGILEYLTKYYHQCQITQKSPYRFKFTLRDNYNFNYEVVIDVLWIDSKPVLQAVDTATAFQAARFLKDMSAKCA